LLIKRKKTFGAGMRGGGDAFQLMLFLSRAHGGLNQRRFVYTVSAGVQFYNIFFFYFPSFPHSLPGVWNKQNLSLKYINNILEHSLAILISA
jgi:hypothetical protein